MAFVTPPFSEPGPTARVNRIPRTGALVTNIRLDYGPPIQPIAIGGLDSRGGNPRTLWYNRYISINKYTKEIIYLIIPK